MFRVWYWLPIVVVLMTAGAIRFLSAQNASRDAVLFVNLTSDDPWRAEMAINYATQAQQLGYKVVVFLNVRGVYLARQKPPAPLEKAQSALIALRRAGAKVYVCPSCSRRAGMRVIDDWIGGVEAGSAEVVHTQMDSQTRVMSY